MKTNNKLTILLLLGALISGGAGWYFTQAHIEQEKSAFQNDINRKLKAVQVVVAAVDLPAGTVISVENAVMREMPQNFIHKNAVHPNRFDAALAGRQLMHPVRAGEAILDIHVSQVKVDGLSSLLEEGQRAVTIPVTTLDINSGFLNPGDHVDVYITVKDGVRDRTVPLVENVRVLASGTNLDDGVPVSVKQNQKDNKRQQVATELTLAVTPLGATRILHGQTVGQLAVLLRRPDDSTSSFDDYVTIDNLIDIPQEAPPAPTRKATWGFELIKGGTRS